MIFIFVPCDFYCVRVLLTVYKVPLHVSWHIFFAHLSTHSFIKNLVSAYYLPHPEAGSRR